MSGDPVFGVNTYVVCCGGYMGCQTTGTFVDDGVQYRQRYWVCGQCGRREKTVDEIPVALRKALIVVRKASRSGGGTRGGGAAGGHGSFRRH